MKIFVNTKQNKYNICIKQNILYDVSDYIKINRSQKVFIITDNNIPLEYVNILKRQYSNSFVYTIRSGEKSKSISNYKNILKCLVENNFNRKDSIIALGDGVVGDLSGFVASTYMRGIDFYNIPTYLLSMVDSSIGGKTAINFLGFKNIVGSFNQPKSVCIDINLLKTLPKRNFYNGLVESIKMAATFDKELFNFINNSTNINNDIEKIIVSSLKLKKQILEQDEREIGLRKTLNFGHTLGHVIEELSFGKLYHGECVGIGMLYFSSKDVRKKLENV